MGSDLLPLELGASDKITLSRHSFTAVNELQDHIIIAMGDRYTCTGLGKCHRLFIEYP